MSACPECGLTFKNGEPTYATFGKPTITLKAHRAFHKKEHAREEELEARAARINSLPGVLAHRQAAECEQLGELAEKDVSVREELATHARKFGGEGVYTISREQPTDGRARRSAERDLRERGRKRSRRRVGVKEELRDLMERKPKLLPSVAADVLNISDRRVKTLLAELRSEGALTG